MLCKKCGFGMSNQANFCPKCGEKVPEEIHAANRAPKGSGTWLKVLLGLILTGLVAAFLIFLFSDNMTDTVDDQLDAIKENKLTEAYYSYTSKSFQEATSLSTFREFMEQYPIFSKHKSVRFIDRNSSNDDAGSLHAMIMNEEGEEIPVQYQLVKEGDKWLINGIKLDDTDPEEEHEHQSDSEEAFDSTPLKSVIKEMMKEIKKGNLKNAYEAYTSSEFKETTAFQDFENFVKENPSFSENKSVDLDNLTFDNNIATITGTLKDASGKEYSAEYNLADENNEWKIFHVRVWAKDPNGENGTRLVFSKFVLGSEIDKENVVTDPKTVFKPDSGDIYLNLSLEHVKTGTKIEVIFEHVDTRSTIPTVTKRVMESGNVTLAFIFSPPKTGWPVGNYRITAMSSTGERNTYDFKVEA